jgi:phage shock protein PspC (stress-responsive transcriptional regulator)
MNKVVTINLNGRAYQLEESGYDALRAYLSDAEARLSNDPGKTEIIADLEQAIAEKCDKVLAPHKNVVSSDEVGKIIEEMGPVQNEGAKNESSEKSSSTSSSAPKRLYLIREGAVLAGVCRGLAAYFDVDVTIVRVIFAVLTILTGGAWIAVYIALALIIPYADTAEKRAEAHGEAFSAQDIVDRAKERVEESVKRFTGNAQTWHDAHIEKHWKRYAKQERQYWKQQSRQWRHAQRTSQNENPVLGIMVVILGLLWIGALISLIRHGAVFGWVIPAGIPIWVAIILLFILFHAVTGPMRTGGSHWENGEYYYRQSAWEGFVSGLTVLFLAIALTWAYLTIPQVHSFVVNLPQEIKMAMHGFGAWVHSL